MNEQPERSETAASPAHPPHRHGRIGVVGLMAVQAGLAGALLFAVGRCLLTVLGVLAGTLDERRGCFPVIVMGTAVAAGAVATLVGLLRRQRTAFFVSAAFVVMLSMVAVVGAMRGYAAGSAGLFLAVLLALFHYLAWGEFSRAAP